MPNSKITIVGAGNVGASAAYIAASKQLGDIVLLDVVEGLAEGKALDIAEASPVQLYDVDIRGTTDWKETGNSDIVIITSGMVRKPGMSRDELLHKNTEIIKQVSRETARYCPSSIVIVVCNPLDAMTYAAAKITGFEKNKVIGMAGALDCARFAYFLSKELDVSVEDVRGVLMGGHGDDMVPLSRYTSVNGIPVNELLCEDRISELIERTQKGGMEVVNLLGYSAYYAPAAGTVRMAESILRDKKNIFSCCVYCNRQYNAGGYFVGAPAILGKNGVERVIELDLTDKERASFNKSLEHVKQLSGKVDALITDNNYLQE